MRRHCVWLFILAAVVGLTAACGGSGSESPPDLSSVRDALPMYPGASVVRQGARPNTAVEGNDDLFSYDRLYVVYGLPQQDEMLSRMTELLKQAGWLQDEEATSRSEGMRYYCSLGYVKCASFAKEGARVVVSVPLPLSFNPVAPQGANYHTHLEEQ